jgi:uncharacterized protein (DUF433 family)
MRRTPNDMPGLRNGVYSYQEAARLLNVSSQRVVRWADGYSFKLKYGMGKSEPVLQTERHAGVLSFPELFELFFVRAYAALKVPLPKIRATAEALAKDIGPYPFSRSKLIVEGRRLLVWHSEDLLMQPDIGQLVADFADGLKERVEFRDEMAGRYKPEGYERWIYLDREIRGGEAVVTEHAIPTRAIYGLWEKERNLGVVAEYHDIDEAAVHAAIRYEGQWRLAA